MTAKDAAPPRSLTRRILSQSWPILVSHWAGVSFGVIDTMMVGHISAQDLQVISLGAAIVGTVLLSLCGVVEALIPIMSHHIGANARKRVGALYGQGFWLCLFLTAVAAGLLLMPDLWLSLSGSIEPAARERIRQYLLISILSAPPFLMYRVVVSLCTSNQKVRQVTTVSLAAVLVKLALNYIFVFGHLGLPALGSSGAALSSVLVSWFSFGLGLFIVHNDAFYQRFELQLGRLRWRDIAEILRLGLPLCGSYLVEICAFTFMAFFAAREGVYASGAHQIMANLMAVLYMTPLALGIACASLTALELGRGRPACAHATVRRAMLISLVAAILTSVLVLLLKPQLLAAYTSTPHIAALAGGLLSFVPIFHIIDSYQCLNVFALRAHKVATPPFVLQIVLLIGGGLGGGFFFGYGPGRGMLDGITSVLLPGAPPGVACLWFCASACLLPCGSILQLFYRRVNRLKQHESNSRVP